MASTVTLIVDTEPPLAFDPAVAAGRRWADLADDTLDGRFVYASTSHSDTEPRLHTLGGYLGDDEPDLSTLRRLYEQAIAEQGSTVTSWEAVEYRTAAESERRQRAYRPMPEVVNATEFAELAGVTRQRIYQWESERKAGNRDGFPTPILDGYWLASAARHWATTRKTTRGPDPRKTA